eukprot:Rhum_TRINITY_DN14423_c12_g1::Rhum_TRINITY_DN14423_c12_g1_i1::g.89015::m.89015
MAEAAAEGGSVATPYKVGAALGAVLAAGFASRAAWRCCSNRRGSSGGGGGAGLRSTKQDELDCVFREEGCGFSVRYPKGWSARVTEMDEMEGEGTTVFKFWAEGAPDQAAVLLVFERLAANVSLSTYVKQTKTLTHDQMVDLGLNITSSSAPSFHRGPHNELAQWCISVGSYHTWNCVCVHKKTACGLLVNATGEVFEEMVEYATAMANSVEFL